MDTTNEMDSIFEDIMNEERKRTEVNENIGVSEKESLVLTEMMEVMKDAPASANDGAKVSLEELEKLSAVNELSATVNNDVVDYTKLDSKLLV